MIKASFIFLATFTCAALTFAAEPRTRISIVGDAFHINERPTYAGRSWNGKRIEGLLFNSRMVQATFDDLNPETHERWAYPDTKTWDADRNLREFLAAMPEWRKHGLLGITVNLQGGSPQGYSKEQLWHNSGFTESGALRLEYIARLERVLARADELGMVVIVGYFYFGQDERLTDEAAVIAATDAATNWLLKSGFRNVLVEVNNECNVKAYDHEILKPDRVHELIGRVRRTEHDSRRLLVGTSYGGGAIPRENVVRSSDFLLLHGNGVKEPERITEMVRKTRDLPGYRPMPILFNEDDHFNFAQPTNNFSSAAGEYASWGYFDYRMKGEGFDEGYQTVPVNWGISSARKRGFFKLLSEMTGAKLAAHCRGSLRDPTLPRGGSHDVQHPRFELVLLDKADGDLSVWDERWVSRFFEGVEAVVHLAGNPVAYDDWDELTGPNIDAVLNVFEATARAGAKRLIFASSNHVMGGYQDGEPIPITTSLPPKPGLRYFADGAERFSGPYAATKLFGERLGQHYATTRDLEVIAVRIGWVWRGTNEPAQLPPERGEWFRKMWLSDRDFLHLMDCCLTAALPEPFVIVNGMSNNTGMRWDLSGTEKVIGYRPQDTVERGN